MKDDNNNMESISIERVTTKEIDELQKISKETFFETFSEVNTKENMQQYLNEELSLEKLRSEFSRHSEFYFAKLDGNVIGYLKLNFGASQTELKGSNAVEIERIYVLKEFHGKNIGQMLYDKAIQVVKARCADYVWLGVWEENRRAIRFYEKNGFVAFDKHIFMLGDDKQTDIMMKLMLSFPEITLK